MSICICCEQEMKTADSCTGNHFKIRDIPPVDYSLSDDDGSYKYGWEEYSSIKFYSDYSDRCPDCGVTTGGFHHPGCDMEKCPVCNGQLLMCNCCY